MESMNPTNKIACTFMIQPLSFTAVVYLRKFYLKDLEDSTICGTFYFIQRASMPQANLAFIKLKLPKVKLSKDCPFLVLASLKAKPVKSILP